MSEQQAATKHGSRKFRGTMPVVALGMVLACCTESSSGGVSAPAGPGAPERLCARLGFAPGNAALVSCLDKLDGLTRQQGDNQKRCEGIRQRALSRPFPSAGAGNTIATAEADYQSCMSGQLIAPAQLPLPTGGTATCRVIRQEITCN